MLRRFINRIILKLYRLGASLHQDNIYEGFRKIYDLHETFRFNGVDIILAGEGKIRCGKDSYIGSYSTLLSYKDCEVVIGDGCSISYNVRMYTHSSDADQDFSIKPVKDKMGDIIIGNYVWIGANVFISPGVRIGDNSVIGANSMVTHDVEPFTIVGGVPAKFIRKKRLPIVS